MFLGTPWTKSFLTVATSWIASSISSAISVFVGVNLVPAFLASAKNLVSNSTARAFWWFLVLLSINPFTPYVLRSFSSTSSMYSVSSLIAITTGCAVILSAYPCPLAVP